MGYGDPDARCPQKVTKLNHSLTPLIRAYFVRVKTRTSYCKRAVWKYLICCLSVGFRMEAAALFPVDDPIAEPPALPRPVIPSYGHPFSLFVSMPTAEVHRLRDLGSIVTCEEVREKLELVAGLPSDIYSLQWPDGTEFTEGQQLSFGQDTRDGAVIKAKVLDNWMELFMAICRNAKREVYRLIKDHPTRPQTKESRQQAEKAPMAQEGARQQTQQAPPPEVNSQPELGLTTPSEGEYVIFICLYLACHRGLFDMVKRILEQCE